MPRGVEVSLLGQTLVLRSDLDPERLRAIVDYVRQRAEEAGRGVMTASPSSLALLTALNLAEELFAERARVEQLVDAIDTRLHDSPAMPVMGADPLSR